MNLNEYKKRAFAADPELYDEYKALAPEYELIKQIIQARAEQNLTEEEIVAAAVADPDCLPFAGALSSAALLLARIAATPSGVAVHPSTRGIAQRTR